MKVAVANDHRGHEAIEQVKAIIMQLGFECIDLSCKGDQPVDYPDIAYRASRYVAEKQADRAVLICGTGRVNTTMLMCYAFPATLLARQDCEKLLKHG